MEKIKLTLAEILELRGEIYGLQNLNTGEQITEGLLKQALPYVTKYWLHELGERLLEEEKLINKLRDGLIEKYGEKDEQGNMGISGGIEDGTELDKDGNEVKKYKVNPKFIEFQQEINTMLAESKEVEYKPFKLEDLKDINTKEDYPIFRKITIVE